MKRGMKHFLSSGLIIPNRVSPVALALLLLGCQSQSENKPGPAPFRGLTMGMPSIEFVDSLEEISDPMTFRLEDGSLVPPSAIERTVQSARLERGYWLDRFDIRYLITGVDVAPQEFSRTIYKTYGHTPTPLVTDYHQFIQIENRYHEMNAFQLKTRFPLTEPIAPRIQVRPVTFNSSCEVISRGTSVIDDTPVVRDVEVAGLYYPYAPSALVEGQVYEVLWSNLKTDALDESVSIRKFMVLAPGDLSGDARVDQQDRILFREKAAEYISSGDSLSLWGLDFLDLVPSGDYDVAVASNREFLDFIADVENERPPRLKSPVPCLRGPTQATQPLRLVSEVPSIEYTEKVADRTPFEEIYTDKVLVAYNQNDPDGLELARYYQSKRGLSSDQICSLQLPFGDFATLRQLIEAKSKLHRCICDLVSDVAGCNSKTPEELAEISPITHLVFVGIVPIRMIETGWDADTPDLSGGRPVSADRQMPVFQYHLAAALYNSLITSEAYEGGTYAPNSDQAFAYTGLRILGLSQRNDGDRTSVRLPPLSARLGLAHGNIRAATKERTKELMDEYVESEDEGFRGNILIGQRANIGDFNNVGGFLVKALGQDFEKCSRYIGDEILSWDHLECRVGVDGRGRIPGESGSDIEKAVNASLYLGTEYEDNSHAGFENFQTMLNWRLGHQSCVPLCRDFQSESERELCRQQSKDVYREINSSCVSVNPSFLGWQSRSWAVQYMGTFVNGWEGTEYGFGPKTPSTWLPTGGAEASNGNTGFIRFGKNANPSSVTQSCETTSGQGYECQSAVPISFERFVNLPAGRVFAPGDSIELRLAHRAWIPRGQLSVGVGLESTSRRFPFVLEDRIPLSQFEPGQWRYLVKSDAVPPSVSGGSRAWISLYASLANGIQGAIDIDEIEVTLVSAAGQRLALLGDHRGDFSQVVTERTTAGDWAANIIDRMGGMGAWGSANHHLVGGHAFGFPLDLVATLFSGRSLGESLMQAGRPQSGLVFVDPLYQPWGVKIYTATPMRKVGENSPLTPSMLSTRDEIVLTAFNGRSPNQSWKLEICTSSQATHSCGHWQSLLSGTGPVDELRTGLFLEDFIVDDRKAQTVVLRLRANPASSQAAPIFDTLTINYSGDR